MRGAIVLILLLLIAGCGSPKLVLEATSEASAMPAELIDIYGSFDPSKEILVRFWYSDDFKVDVPVTSAAPALVTVSVPPFMDMQTGEFAEGEVKLQVIQRLSGIEEESNIFESIYIESLPSNLAPPGTITLEFIDAMIGSLEDSISKSESIEGSEELRQSLNAQIAHFTDIHDKVKTVMDDSSVSYPIGEIMGEEVLLNTDSLVVIDSLIAAQAMQFVQHENVAVVYDDPELEVVRSGIEKMFKDVRKGVQENKDIMSGFGSAAVAVGGALTLIPGGQLPGVALIGLGALTWFVSTHAHAGFAIGTGASLEEIAPSEHDALKKDVQGYMKDVVLNGAQYAGGVYSPAAGLASDSLTLLQQANRVHKKLTEGEDTSDTVKPQDPAKKVEGEVKKKYAVLVAVSGEGTIVSDPAGISCIGDCTELYDEGTEVILTATPKEGAEFDGWSGACSGTGSCKLTVNADKAATATFTKGGKFDGQYKGRYQGKFVIESEFGDVVGDIGDDVIFSVQGGVVTVTYPGSGSGTVSDSGDTDFSATSGALGVDEARCSFSGGFTLSGASGKWNCKFSEGSSSGTWNADKISVASNP